jgi:hypothetical protein
MSLKSFHLVFITICTLLFAFLTLWSFVLSPEISAMTRVLGYVGIAGIILTAVYGVYFQRKVQRIHI